MVEIMQSEPVQAAGVGAGLVGLAFVLRKLVSEWRSSAADDARATGEATVLHGMTAELKRLQDLTGDLSSRVKEMHLETVTLHNEIASLRVENGNLRLEIGMLTEQNGRLRIEIASLQTEIQNLRGAR